MKPDLLSALLFAAPLLVQLFSASPDSAPKPEPARPQVEVHEVAPATTPAPAPKPQLKPEVAPEAPKRTVSLSQRQACICARDALLFM